MRARLLIAASMAAAGSLAWPGQAQAAGLLYAAPSGVNTGTCSTVGTACNLPRAMAVAPSGAEVVVLAGSYSVGSGEFLNTTQPDVNVHGEVGQPRPVVTTVDGFIITKSGTRLADLTVIQTGSGIAVDSRALATTYERLEVHAPGDACVIRDGLIRDTVCTATGTEVAALATDDYGYTGARTVRVRNVTAIANGADSVGLLAHGSNVAPVTVDARNVIASGTADVDANGTGNAASVTITMVSSNYDVAIAPLGTVTPAGSGTNQTQPPLFADSTGYHQAPGSPTIDHGTTDAFVGTVDLDRDARPQGAAMDIGADEVVVPVAVPPDTTPPDTTLTKGPKKKTTSKKATFTFSSEPGATFRCVLDKLPAKPCSSPYGVAKLKPGKHTFAVAAIDAAGNVDPTPATYTWKIKKKRHRH